MNLVQRARLVAAWLKPLLKPRRRNGTDQRGAGEFEPGRSMRVSDRGGGVPGEPVAAPAGGRAQAWREVLRGTAGRRRGDLIDPHRQGALNRRLLALLVIARMVMAFAGLAALLIWGGGIADFPLLHVSLVLLAIGGLNLFVRSALKRVEPPSETLFLGQLLGDLVLLGSAFHASGGIENPFAMLVVVPLTLAAYALSWRSLAAFVAATTACLLLLYRFHVEVPAFSELARGVSGLVVVSLLTYLAYSVSRLVRTHERAVARAREDALRARGAEALGSVAATAADALGSPLATISVLINELRQGRLPPSQRSEALAVLDQQVEACKRSISELLASVGQARGESGSRRRVEAMLFAVARECQLLDPRVSVLFEPMPVSSPQIVENRSLVDAFALIFKQCAQTPPHKVFVAVRWDPEFVTVDLCGADSPAHGADKAPRPVQAQPGNGSLAVAASLLARVGATLARLGDEREWSYQVQLPNTGIGAPKTSGAEPLGADR